MKHRNAIITPCIYIIFFVISRLIPHPPNVTPLINLTWYAKQKFSRSMSTIILLTGLFFSDLGLHIIYNYPIFGSWSFFTYTGLILISLSASKLNPLRFKTYLIAILASGLFFWTWTNFGTWLTTSLYPKNSSGLLNCYIMALPFLRNQLLGDLGWAILFFNVSIFFAHEKQNAHTH